MLSFRINKAAGDGNIDNYIIRNERSDDWRKVEILTRKAFWNIHTPGCVEHYLVNIMRGHEDFIGELDFVVECDKKIVGNIMYTKATLTNGEGAVKNILTFGPISILPEYQRKGLGKLLMEHSFSKALELGYDTVVIMGDPGNYVSAGFKSCNKLNISAEDGSYPCAMLVKELKEGCLNGQKWIYKESPLFNIDEEQANEFDKNFEPMEKAFMPSQEAFYIFSHSKIV